MRIVFLCTSLAPGRDGVGDYVRQLSTACAAQGHCCLLIALNDRNISGQAMMEGPGEIRMPAALRWSQRTTKLIEVIGQFQPDWISWQLVPYGFHPKGVMPAGVLRMIDALRPWRSHVMVHEIWVGLARNDRVMLRMTGLLQRHRFLRFLRRLRPSCIHTTNPAYQLALAYHGWPSEILPLFGNMPVLPRNPAAARSELDKVAAGLLPPEPRLVGVIFGSIHPQWKPEPTFEFLERVTKKTPETIVLLTVGRTSVRATRLLVDLVQPYCRIKIITAGAQSPETISLLLHAADFGIATHPWALIEKSGTAATFLEHGLPVLVPRDDWQLRHGETIAPTDPLLRRLSDLDPSSFRLWLGERRAPAARLPALAARFIGQLREPVPGGALVA